MEQREPIHLQFAQSPIVEYKIKVGKNVTKNEINSNYKEK